MLNTNRYSRLHILHIVCKRATHIHITFWTIVGYDMYYRDGFVTNDPQSRNIIQNQQLRRYV